MKEYIDPMWDDKPIDVSAEVNFIWSIANKLRGPYQSDKYKDVIIPMTILRRFECALAPKNEGIVSPAYFVYGFSDDDYNPRYFHYFMRNANNNPEYRRLSGGIREGQWDLSPYDLGNMPVIVPPKAEQNEIVAYLDEKSALLDKSTADKQTQIETLKSYKSSLIYEYVTGKKQVI
jgi:restriction endonuclease S subunit